MKVSGCDGVRRIAVTISFRTLARASTQSEAGQDVDLPALLRARTLVEAAIAAYPSNAYVQSEGVRIRDQVVRALARNESGHAAS